VDCYGEEEEFTGVMAALADGLGFPLKATVMGETLEVVGIDDGRSGLRRGAIARVRRGGQEYPIGLAELEFVGPDRVSAEWLAVY
jgi:hypothetical protein